MAEVRSQEHVAESTVAKRFVITLPQRVQQTMKLEIGDVLWFYPTDEDGMLLVKKAPEEVQKLSKSVNTR